MPNPFGDDERRGSQGRIPDAKMDRYTLYQRVQVTIDPETFERLERYCKDEERARSWVIQKAVAMFLESKGY